MGDLSQHFSSDEFRCPDCGKGRPTGRLLNVLQGARLTAGVPILITSGYRCRRHNLEVGGCEPCEHGNYYTEETEAADVFCQAAQMRYLLLKSFLDQGVTRIGIGNYHLHIGTGQAFPQNVIFPDKEKI